ncbi:fasciclin-1 [Anopheles cruzii]|uniref:fasciclin-1 n=1 Tax=Anopheles cruzii TaxID=68878 RepID=UPI0022EC28B4|nr:fasciclin-1 [Anopheles cruzii]
MIATFCELLLTLWLLGHPGLLPVHGSTVPHSVEVRIREDPDLSQFYSLIEQDDDLLLQLKHRSLTVFAPSNRAFQRYSGNKTHVRYHITTKAIKLKELGDTVLTMLNGNPPLYVTRRKAARDSGYAREEIFINNAMVLLERSDYNYTSDINKKQVLHIIDDVLTPVGIGPNETRFSYKLDAWDLLLHAESIPGLAPQRVGAFRKKVSVLQQEQIFRAPGLFTFFIPVESHSKVRSSMTRLDRMALEGHIVPGRALFTVPAPYDEPFPTLAFGDNTKITVNLIHYGTGRESRVFVMSRTMLTNSRLSSGAVVAEIVKANIPVTNGVVHLIHRPLVIVDMKISQFLQEQEDGIVSKFTELIEDYVPEFFQLLQSSASKTLLVPDNDAVNRIIGSNFLTDRKKMQEILAMHLIRDSMPIDKIKRANQAQLYQIPTASRRMFLYFNVLENRETRDQRVTVEGGGVNATVLLNDITAIDGYIHIIDRVLGLPYMTVQQKIESDPMLNLTNHFGRLNGFNHQLGKTTKRYTYFVPRDKAWIQWFYDHPAARLDSFVRNFNQTRAVLERHLIVADRVFSMGELKNMSIETLILPTIGPVPLRIRVREEDRRFFMQWRDTGKWINVFRHDVECTNGLIHVIDAPFLLDEDLSGDTSRGTRLVASRDWPLLGAVLGASLITSVLTQLFARSRQQQQW